MRDAINKLADCLQEVDGDCIIIMLAKGDVSEPTIVAKLSDKKLKIVFQNCISIVERSDN